MRCVIKFAVCLIPLLLPGCGSSSGDNQYVAIGASDATGIGATPLNNGYVFRIERSLEERGNDIELINLGIPAAEADTIVDSSLEVAEEVGPDLITIWVGPNDIVAGREATDFEADLREIFSELSSENPFFFIANVPDLTMLPRFRDEPDQDVTVSRIQQYNEVISALANEFNATLIDLFAVNFGESLVSEDGFHPSDEGHEVIANLFLDAITASSFEETLD